MDNVNVDLINIMNDSDDDIYEKNTTNVTTKIDDYKFGDEDEEEDHEFIVEDDYESSDDEDTKSIDVLKMPKKQENTIENRMEKISLIKSMEKRNIKSYKKFNKDTHIDELDMILRQQESQLRLVQSIIDYKTIINGGVWTIDQVFSYYPLFGMNLDGISYNWNDKDIQLQLGNIIEDFQKKHGHITLPPEARFMMLLSKVMITTNMSNKSKGKKGKGKKKKK